MTLTEINTARHHGLNMTDLQVLHILAEHGPRDMTWISVDTGLTNSAITVCANRLCKKQLIQRTRDKNCKILELTELGRIRLYQISGIERDGEALPPPSQPVDCGGGIPIGICPECGRGHGYPVMRAGKPIPV